MNNYNPKQYIPTLRQVYRRGVCNGFIDHARIGTVIDRTTGIGICGTALTNISGLSTYHINELLFNKNFAKSIGYSLVELAQWCEEDNNPLEFIKQKFCY